MQRSAWGAMPGRRWLVGARRAALGFSAAFVVYVALVVHPQPLFAHAAARGNVVLHAREPLPPESAALLDDVLERVRRSPLYRAERVHHVFLCDTPRLFALFTLWNHNAGGVTAIWANGNVFIRPASVRRGRVVGASGVEKGGERTLAYYIAHEVTHAMSVDRFGRLGYRDLASFQVEGYADYVAFAQPVDLKQGRQQLLAGSVDMDPLGSGHYDRYRLLVGYLLQRRHFTVEQLLSHPLDRKQIEADLLHAAL